MESGEYIHSRAAVFEVKAGKILLSTLTQQWDIMGFTNSGLQVYSPGEFLEGGNDKNEYDTNY